MTEDKHYLAALKARHAVFTERELMNAQSGLTVNAGVMHCPICEPGSLTWAVMPNGHLHMECDTPGCVAWVE